MIIKHKKAYYHYYILETFQAGISLTGPEVKSIKNQAINLDGSFVTIKNNEAFLLNVKIAPYQPHNLLEQFFPTRSRKLLLTKKELRYLTAKLQQKGLSVIPLSIYTKQGMIKVEIGIVKSKSKRDKREIIKKRDIEREIRENK